MNRDSTRPGLHLGISASFGLVLNSIPGCIPQWSVLALVPELECVRRKVYFGKQSELEGQD